MKKHFALAFTLVLLLALTLTATVLAQEEMPELEIRLNRDFGYGGFGNDIQGLFTIKVSGPDDLEKVEFYIDDTLLGMDEEAPFRIQFNTDNFDFGIHQISAVGTLADGTELRSRQITSEFVSGDQVMDFLIPVLGLIALVTVGAAVLPMLTGKKGQAGPIGEYGPAGGAVCPRCQFPFSRHWLSPNLAVGKLVRCPHCGKWSIRARASFVDLAAAEDRLRLSRQEGSPAEVDPEKSLKRALDDSRFEE
jgi:hypothetical protein